jgi:hypothetical protein
MQGIMQVESNKFKSWIILWLIYKNKVIRIIEIAAKELKTL